MNNQKNHTLDDMIRFFLVVLVILQLVKALEFQVSPAEKKISTVNVKIFGQYGE